MIEPIRMTPFSLAQRFIGLREVDGKVANPAILAMLNLDATWPQDDDVPWCSAFLNYIFWLLRLPRSKSLSARSWLDVGSVVETGDAQVGFDVVILTRLISGSPTSGHVGLFAGWRIASNNPSLDNVYVLGGNQSNSVSVAPFPIDRLLGIRRISA